MGQGRERAPFVVWRAMSALPPQADIVATSLSLVFHDPDTCAIRSPPVPEGTAPIDVKQDMSSGMKLDPEIFR